MSFIFTKYFYLKFIFCAVLMIFLELKTSAAPITSEASIFNQFLKFIKDQNCQVPSYIDLPFNPVPDESNPWKFMSIPLKICQTPESSNPSKVAFVLCSEIFDVLTNLTCGVDQRIKLQRVRVEVFEDICPNLNKMKDLFPDNPKYLGKRLSTDPLVCSLTCSEPESGLACSFLLWAYEVQKQVYDAINEFTTEYDNSLNNGNSEYLQQNRKDGLQQDNSQALEDAANQYDELKHNEVDNPIQPKDKTADQELPHIPVKNIAPDKEIKQTSEVSGNKQAGNIETQQLHDKQTGKDGVEGLAPVLGNINPEQNTQTEIKTSKNDKPIETSSVLVQNVDSHPNNEVQNEQHQEQEDVNAIDATSQDVEKKKNTGSQNVKNVNFGNKLEVYEEKPVKGTTAVKHDNNNTSGGEKPIPDLINNKNTSIKSDQADLNSKTTNPDINLLKSSVSTTKLSTQKESRNATEFKKKITEESLVPDMKENEISSSPDKHEDTGNENQIIPASDNQNNLEENKLSSTLDLQKTTDKEMKISSKPDGEKQASKGNDIESDIQKDTLKNNSLSPDLKKDDKDNLHGHKTTKVELKNTDESVLSSEADSSIVLKSDIPVVESSKNSQQSSTTLSTKEVAIEDMDDRSNIMLGREPEEDIDMENMEGDFVREYPHMEGGGRAFERQVPINRSPFPEQEDSHFFFYFLSIIFVIMAGYLIFHNKQKIIALIVEGRHERRRRSHGVGYKKLETK